MLCVYAVLAFLVCPHQPLGTSLSLFWCQLGTARSAWSPRERWFISAWNRALHASTLVGDPDSHDQQSLGLLALSRLVLTWAAGWTDLHDLFCTVSM